MNRSSRRHSRHGLRGVLLSSFALLLFAGARVDVTAQIVTDSPFNEVAFPEGVGAPPDPRLPQIGLKVVGEHPLPGPLPGQSPRLAGGIIHLPLRGAVALIDLYAESPVSVLPRDEAPAFPAEEDPRRWVVEPSGKRRFKTDDGGILRAQRRCKLCRKGWRNTWKLRLPGGTPAPPLVLDGQVIVGALDNRIYAVRPRNGHRLWTYDVGQRFSKPPALWSGDFRLNTPTNKKRRKSKWESETIPAELVLVVPDSGDSLIVLDAESGRRVAHYKAAQIGERLIGMPLVSTHGEIAVARQRFARADAGLLVFVLESLAPTHAGGAKTKAPEPPRIEGSTNP